MNAWLRRHRAAVVWPGRVGGGHLHPGVELERVLVAAAGDDEPDLFQRQLVEGIAGTGLNG